MAPGRNPCLYLFNYANSTAPPGESANEYPVALTQDTLLETGSLPRALESQFSSVRQILYYNNIERFTDAERSATTVTSVEALFPVQ